MVEDYISFAQKNGYLDYRRNQQAKYWMYETINSALLSGFYQNEKMEPLIQDMENRVLNNEISSFIAAHQLLDVYNKQ